MVLAASYLTLPSKARLGRWGSSSQYLWLVRVDELRTFKEQAFGRHASSAVLVTMAWAIAAIVAQG